MPELNAALQRAESWLVGEALPKWAGVGFDPKRRCFEEQLGFDGKPVVEVPRRVMVQARQIATYSAAAVSGLFPAGLQLAQAAAEAAIACYHRVDGRPGWVFSIDRNGGIVDTRRDLYAHSFLLFAFAWLARATGNESDLNMAYTILGEIDEIFPAPTHGGYVDALPRPDLLRRQNPHMHLFEGLLALHRVSGAEAVLERCRAMNRLARTRFIDPETGALREYFTDDWAVHPAPGQGSVEPGHLFEWAWLLRWYEDASGEDQSAIMEPMLRLALSAGTDPFTGRVVDEIGEDGHLRQRSSRCWPHAEALKALTVETMAGRADYTAVLEAILNRLSTVYCRSELGGGWVDLVDETDRPKSKIMPASSLYHLYFGLTEALHLERKEANHHGHGRSASPQSPTLLISAEN